jgi:hypothetical protein
MGSTRDKAAAAGCSVVFPSEAFARCGAGSVHRAVAMLGRIALNDRAGDMSSGAMWRARL